MPLPLPLPLPLPRPLPLPLPPPPLPPLPRLLPEVNSGGSSSSPSAPATRAQHINNYRDKNYNTYHMYRCWCSLVLLSLAVLPPRFLPRPPLLTTFGRSLIPFSNTSHGHHNHNNETEQQLMDDRTLPCMVMLECTSYADQLVSVGSLQYSLHSVLSTLLHTHVQS